MNLVLNDHALISELVLHKTRLVRSRRRETPIVCWVDMNEESLHSRPCTKVHRTKGESTKTIDFFLANDRFYLVKSL